MISGLSRKPELLNFTVEAPLRIALPECLGVLGLGLVRAPAVWASGFGSFGWLSLLRVLPTPHNPLLYQWAWFGGQDQESMASNTCP